MAVIYMLPEGNDSPEEVEPQRKQEFVLMVRRRP